MAPMCRFINACRFATPVGLPADTPTHKSLPTHGHTPRMTLPQSDLERTPPPHRARQLMEDMHEHFLTSPAELLVCCQSSLISAHALTQPSTFSQGKPFHKLEASGQSVYRSTICNSVAATAMLQQAKKALDTSCKSDSVSLCPDPGSSVTGGSGLSEVLFSGTPKSVTEASGPPPGPGASAAGRP